MIGLPFHSAVVNRRRWSLKSYLMSDQSLSGGPDPQWEIAELKRRLQAAEAQLQALQKAPSEVAPSQAE